MTDYDTTDLTLEEEAAIKSLASLAKRWPRSLTLASMDGELIVYRTGDPRFLAGDESAIVADDFRGIPNTGGGF